MEILNVKQNITLEFIPNPPHDVIDGPVVLVSNHGMVGCEPLFLRVKEAKTSFGSCLEVRDVFFSRDAAQQPFNPFPFIGFHNHDWNVGLKSRSHLILEVAYTCHEGYPLSRIFIPSGFFIFDDDQVHASRR